MMELYAMMHRDGYGDRNGDGSGDGKQKNLKIMGTGTVNIYYESNIIRYNLL
ncbi:unnamed protein product [Brassica napus]|uniref:(rape) hypothetical protein n=1 Tax=Brassica napus TaxID=3708 RepID=A0A816KPR1_BRANA|nr:unnamed protein product [Brassica napus]